LALTVFRWARIRESSANLGSAEWKKLLVALAIAVILLWGSYGFSVGHVREEFNLSVNSMPSFQHFPAVMRNTAQSIVANNWQIPAPAFFHGFAEAWVLNKSIASTYMFGVVRESCWYFFLAGSFLKSPLPLLILCVIGLGFLTLNYRKETWSAAAPAVAIGAIADGCFENWFLADNQGVPQRKTPKTHPALEVEESLCCFVRMDAER